MPICMSIALLLASRLAPVAVPVHDAPVAAEGAVLAYELVSSNSDGRVMRSVVGPPARLADPAVFERDPTGESMRFDGTGSYLTVAPRVGDFAGLPRDGFTLSSWVRVDATDDWGGIISAVSDNGGRERGWVLGFNRNTFSVGLSSEGADDGDGVLTYLAGKTRIETGRWYHVAATYDGTEMILYVNGRADARSRAQSGGILYDPATPLVVGAYKDANETHVLTGRLRRVGVANRAVDESAIREDFSRLSALADLPAFAERTFGWMVEPFLCFATQESVSIVCEVPVKAGVTVRYREAGGADREVRSAPAAGIHTLTLEGLRPGTAHYYQVIAADDAGGRIETTGSSFQTAVGPGTAFTFTMIGDTQSQPEVVKRISELSWSHRPNFVCVAGDLVTTGAEKSHWTEHFFPNMQPLIGRVPLFPVLGNHEGNAKHYYDYMNLPAPEYYYQFSYGDADFFVLDTQKPLNSGSEQFAWLERSLERSEAMWKFVIHHKPIYSSDENDYGDTWKGESALGDLNARNLVPLYERHGVDVVFNGHIHVYERTFPVRDGKAVDRNGVIYLTIGGGGGHLEQFAPFNPWFSEKKVRTHHLCHVSVNGGLLRVQAIDDSGVLFDQFEIRKD